MTFCLPKFYTDKFIKALKEGIVDPVKLSDMTSTQRNAFFEGLIGKENASSVNALFESKLLLKNKQAGYISWAKKTAGLKEATRRDIISRIQKMDKVLDATSEATFLKDLASQKLGTEVTFEEAKTIVEMSKKTEELKSKIQPDEPRQSKNRLDYGLQFALFKRYIGELKLKNKKIALRDYLHPGTLFYEISGSLKSILSSMDNSFFGRQGLKVLLDPTTSHIWTRNFVKSWKDIGKELKGQDAMLVIEADVYSRPNAINGKYKSTDVAIGIGSEEAFPGSLPSNVPLLGRLFKASESAYNGGALRMRADLADRLIKMAEENGVDILRDKVEAQSLGDFVNSSTGRGRFRGHLAFLEQGSKVMNVTLFSAKFLKSNIDFLLAPLKTSGKLLTGRKITFGEKQAAYQTLRIIGTITTVMAIANILAPGSVEFDPRSSHFGKIKIGNRWYDITFGSAALVTLAARGGLLIPTMHNGEWGYWTKNNSGKFTKLSSGKFGSLTPVDYIEQFGENKLAPLLSTILTIMKQETYQGEKPTLLNITKNLIQPLSVQTFQSVLDDPNGYLLTTMILEGLGFSSSNPKKK